MGQQNNPFMLDTPNVDLSPVISGIGGLVKQSRERRKQRDDAKRLGDAYASNDADQVAKLMAERPDLINQFNSMAKFRDDSTRENYAESIRGLAGTRDPQQRADILAKRIYQVDEAGGDSTDSQNMLRQLFEDPEGFESSLATDFAQTQPKQAYDEFVRQRTGGADSLKLKEFNLKQQSLELRKVESELRQEELKLKREDNEGKRNKIQLEIDSKKEKIAQTKRDNKAEYQSALDTSNNAIGAVDRLLNHAGLDSAVGVDSIFPTVAGSDAADFEAELESFDAKLFANAIKQMRGMGSLSDAEGKKISASVDALNPKMSNKAFRASLNRIRSTLEKAIATAKMRLPEADKDTVQPEQAGLSQDEQAIQWAQQNPNDPRSAAIMQSQGAQ